MKKILAFIITALLLISMSNSILAAESSTEIDVKANYTHTTDDTAYTAFTNGGIATITTKEGVVVTVTGDFADRLLLMVIPVITSDKDAYTWFSGVLDEKVSNLSPFDIFFMQNGERVQLNTEMTITISLSNEYTTPQIYYVDSLGNATLLDSAISSGEISFKTNHTSFYVLGNKATSSSSPETSDNTQIIPYLLLAFVSLVTCKVIVTKTRVAKDKRKV